jgi:hypothetical protein
MAKKVLYLSRKELIKLVIEELRRLKRVGELSEEDLKEHFRHVYRDLLIEYDVEGLVVRGVRLYNIEFIFDENSFLWYVPKLFGRLRFSDLLDLSFVKSVRVEEGYSLMERLAMRFGLVGMDEVIRKCKKEDKRSADDVWCVYSKKGRLLGRAKTKEDALKRLRQVEYFKKVKGGK